MKKIATVLLASMITAGCSGLTTPEIQEFWGSPGDTSQKVANIVFQVKCELGNAVRTSISVDKTFAKQNGGRILAFMDDWVADLLLILIVDEKGNASPTISGISTLARSQTKAVNVGFNLSSEAIRTEKIHVYYRFSDFLRDKNPPKSCISSQTAKASLFVESDLKIAEWLNYAIVDQATQDSAPYGSLPNKTLSAAFTHDIKFEIISSGGITPTWKLVEYGTAASGSGFTVGSSRDRTQEMILTVGPPDSAPGNRGGENPTARIATTTAEQGAENAKSRLVP